MALGSQRANVELMAALTGLTHDIFVGEVVNNVKRSSVTSSLFKDAVPGDYQFSGANMVFATDLRFKTGALATSGFIPDHVPLDAVQGQVTPIRRMARIAVDNLVERRATGQGSFEDLADRIYNKLWDAWESMEIRHAIGASSGLVCTVSSRTSNTTFVAKDGYGNVSTNPLSHLAEGSILGWWDVDQAQVGGAARITSINYSTASIVMNSAANWETDVGNAIAANDLIYFATSDDTQDDYFELERNLAPNGLGTIVDPTAAATTVFNIAEGTYQRWKPYRVASSTFDHLEVTEHWLQLGAKRGFDVNPSSDVAVTFPSVAAQLARSLMAFQQQAYTGGELRGGYNIGGAAGNDEAGIPHSGLMVAGIPVFSDGFFYHDDFVTLCRDKLYRVNLGGDADFWGEDGSMWSRISDYDGKEAYVVDYMNYMSTHRGAHGALTGISTDLTDANFTVVPNY